MIKKQYEGQLYVVPIKDGEMIVAVSLDGLFLGARLRQDRIIGTQVIFPRCREETASYPPNKYALKAVLGVLEGKGVSLSIAQTLGRSASFVVETRDSVTDEPPMMEWD